MSGPSSDDELADGDDLDQDEEGDESSTSGEEDNEVGLKSSINPTLG
jgi:hypothetical protein